MAKKVRVGAATAVDFSMFDDTDVANIVLQRSEIGDPKAAIKAWIAGEDGPLLAFARANREAILTGAYAIAERECAIFLPSLDAPKAVADIGCGYAFADLVLHRRFGCRVLLIDIEEGNGRHFGFQADGSGYASLARARAFLEANGVPAADIATVNPKQGDLPGERFDLIFSLASCGFHYPVGTYMDFFTNGLAPGGAVVLDVRKGSGGVKDLRPVGEVQILATHPKYSTVLVRRAA